MVALTCNYCHGAHSSSQCPAFARHPNGAIYGTTPDKPECPRCGSTYIVDGKCKSQDCECEEILALNATIATLQAEILSLRAALDKAGAALGTIKDQQESIAPGGHFLRQTPSWAVAVAALAAIAATANTGLEGRIRPEGPHSAALGGLGEGE